MCGYCVNCVFPQPESTREGEGNIDEISKTYTGSRLS